MANVDRITQVFIALKTAGVRKRSFSDLALIDFHSGPDRVSIITESDELLDVAYGLTTTSDLYRAAQVAFSQTPAIARLYILKRIAPETIDASLAACASANNEWYAFAPVAHAESDLLLAAAWGEANNKLHLTCISDVDVTSTSGQEPATALKQGNFFRTAWWYNIDPNQFPEVAIAAKKFTTLPGGDTWANVMLAAVTAPPMSETAYANITAKNGNTFEMFNGDVSMTQNGVTAAGEWIDVIRFRDWLCEEMRVSGFDNFIDNRIPYTDEGIAIFRQSMEKTLDLGRDRGGIAPPEKDPLTNRIIPSYTVSVPAAANVTVSDKRARFLRDMKFTARLAGAIHAIQINGTLTYDNIG